MAASTSPMVVLIGLRGAGKSTVGQLLAHRMAGTFADLDDRTAMAMGEDTPGEALSRHGEAAFRAAEALGLSHALKERLAVLALGGGTPTAPGAAEALTAAQAAGRVRIVYLRASPAALRSRLGSAGASMRPTLTGRGTLVEIEELFAARDPLYGRLANRTIDVEMLSAEEVVDQLSAC